MAILNIRRLSDDVHARLRIRAARAGRSMEAEAREILARACAGGYDAPEGNSQVRDAADSSLSLHLTPGQLQSAQRCAKRRGTTLEDLLRQLLERELAADDAGRWRLRRGRLDTRRDPSCVVPARAIPREFGR